MIEVTELQIDLARPIARAFSAARLTLARQIAAKSKRQLADAIGKTAAAVTQFELGQSKPSPETLAACAQALELPTSRMLASRV